jgi:tetratricopeptide (TPR) repeat protein
MISFFAFLFLAGCRANVPKTASETITLMTKYSDGGRYDDAIKLAQEWLHGHPDDNGATFYEQIAITYLMKASKDPTHKDEFIRQAIAYYDKDLSVHEKQDPDIELYTVGRGLELAGDLTTADACSYYDRAIKNFEDEVGFIQGDTVTSYGHTFKLEPVREENDKALQRVKTKFAGHGCLPRRIDMDSPGSGVPTP